MSIEIPFEVHEAPRENLPPPIVGTDYSTVSAFGALIIIRALTTNYSDEDPEEDPDTLLRREESSIDVEGKPYADTSKINSTCTICTDDFVDSDMVSVMMCNHIFHQRCIHEWGHYKNSCPTCRTLIKENPE